MMEFLAERGSAAAGAPVEGESQVA
jgi:hypothetical protein